MHFCVEYYVDKELTYSCQLQHTLGLEMSIRCFKLCVLYRFSLGTVYVILSDDLFMGLHIRLTTVPLTE